MAKKQKLKTKKAVKKRFKISATGKIQYTKANRRHLLTDKSSKKKRSLKHSTLVSASDVKRLKKMMANIL